jgi:hypothetical protein
VPWVSYCPRCVALGEVSHPCWEVFRFHFHGRARDPESVMLIARIFWLQMRSVCPWVDPGWSTEPDCFEEVQRA